MSYQALYRKFRPQGFVDVKGQEHIVTTLKNQIKADRIGHAYLFCGTRGTGKTTIAKIFAKAVNCEHPVDGSPCGECASCKAIAEGSSLNVIEIDAASNNGVDNIRQISEEVAYRPTEGRYKVYIIDEVHMLSIGAFNALLKTLEEPPSYVIFILATTEFHKIPATILSRCQKYNFRHISADTIEERLQELMDAEGVQVEKKALAYVAKMGDGSMRDALSLLDQCIAFHIGESLTYENVLDVLGAVDTEVFSRFLRNIIDGNVRMAVSVLDELVAQGRELGQFVTDYIWYMRNLMLLQNSDDMESVLDVSAENLRAMKEEAGMVDNEVLMRYIRVFSDLSNQLKNSSQKRVLIEVAIIKLCRPEMEQDYSSLIDRLEQLEKKMAQGISVAVAPSAGHNLAPAADVPKPQLPESVPEDIKALIPQWMSVISELGGIAKIYLKKAVPTLGERGELMLVFDDPTGYGYFNGNRSECKSTLQQLIENRIGKSIEISFKFIDNGVSAKESVPSLLDTINFEIEIDDNIE